MRLILLLSIGAMALSAQAQTSYVAPAKLLYKKGYQVQFLGDYFHTTHTYDVDGKKTSLRDSEKFNVTQGEVGGFYGFADNFQVGIGGRYRRNQSSYHNATNQLVDVSKSGLESTFLSMKYGFKPVEQMQYTIEGLYRYTPFTNSTNDDLILGDDGNEYSAGLVATYSSRSNNYLSVRGGYRKPGKNLSGEMYWQGEGALAWSYFALVAGVDGVSSLNNSAYTDNPSNKPALSTLNSGLYNSVNRQWIRPYAGFNVALGDTWRIETRATQVVSGRSTDYGTGFSIMLARRVESKKGRNRDLKFKTYDIEATVTKVSPKKGYLVLDKGLSSEIRNGMKFDFFEFDYLGGNILVATGSVIKVNVDTSIVKLTQIYNVKREIKEGLIARAAIK